MRYSQAFQEYRQVIYSNTYRRCLRRLNPIWTTPDATRGGRKSNSARILEVWLPGRSDLGNHNYAFSNMVARLRLNLRCCLQEEYSLHLREFLSQTGEWA